MVVVELLQNDFVAGPKRATQNVISLRLAFYVLRFTIYSISFCFYDIGCLGTLRARYYLKFYLFPRFQRLEAVLLYSREMNKNIFATILLDKAISL